MSIRKCPKCDKDGEYMEQNNFDTFKCDCMCEFHMRNNVAVIGKNPFSGHVISQHHGPTCPKCGKECGDSICDNDCGTIYCDTDNCYGEFYTIGNRIMIGHNPTCGEE